jgi:hypothetical protein
MFLQNEAKTWSLGGTLAAKTCKTIPMSLFSELMCKVLAFSYVLLVWNVRTACKRPILHEKVNDLQHFDGFGLNNSLELS